MMFLTRLGRATITDPAMPTINQHIEDLPSTPNATLTLGSGDEDYVIAAIAPGAGFTLEIRDGSIDRHYDLDGPVSADVASAVFESYYRQDGKWRTSCEWRRVRRRDDDHRVR